MNTAYEHMDKLATRYAQSAGFLQGYLIGMMMYDYDITPAKFKNIYETIVRAHELAGTEMSEYDVERFKKRADEVGAII